MSFPRDSPASKIHVLTTPKANPRLRRREPRRRPRRHGSLPLSSLPTRDSRRAAAPTPIQEHIRLHDAPVRLPMVAARRPAAPGTPGLDPLAHAAPVPRLPRRARRPGRDPARLEAEEARPPVAPRALVRVPAHLERLAVRVEAAAGRRQQLVRLGRHAGEA